MDKNPVSSRKSLNNNLTLKGEGIRLPSRDGSSNTQEMKGLSSTQDNFFRKSGKGFNSLSHRSDNHGIIKSDLLQLQEMINENSYFTKMYKLTSKSPAFTKRLTEIEEGKDIKAIIEKLTDDSANVERTGKIYNTTSTTELIQKLTLDISYNELLLRKLNDYFTLLQLKICGDENLYSDSYSKLGVIKIVIEKLLEKYYSTKESNTETFQEETVNTNTNNLPQKSDNNNLFITENKQTEEFYQLLEIKSINELVNNYKNSDNAVILHLVDLFSHFLDKLSNNYSDLLNKQMKTQSNGNNHNFQLEHFFTQKLLIEKLLLDKDEKIKKLNDKNDDTNKNLDLTDKLKAYEDQIRKLEIMNKNTQEELEKLKKENENLKKEKLIAESNSVKASPYQGESQQNLLKIIEENNKTLTQIKKSEEVNTSKLYEEIKDLSAKYNDILNKYEFTQTENIELNKKMEFLSKSVKKDVDFESYEQLLQEQFDTMKNSFVKKIENLNEEMNQIKIDARRKVNTLTEDLTQTTYVKDLFLKQITELQKKLEI